MYWACGCADDTYHLKSGLFLRLYLFRRRIVSIIVGGLSRAPKLSGARRHRDCLNFRSPVSVAYECVCSFSLGFIETKHQIRAQNMHISCLKSIDQTMVTLQRKHCNYSTFVLFLYISLSVWNFAICIHKESGYFYECCMWPVFFIKTRNIYSHNITEINYILWHQIRW